MGADQQRTLVRVKRRRREPIDPKLREHRRRIVRTAAVVWTRPDRPLDTVSTVAGFAVAGE